METQRKLIAMVLLLGICIPLVLGALGDLEIGGDIYLLDDNWIGLGPTKGKVAFQDETIDGVRIDDAYLGISIPSGTQPLVPLHISRGHTPTNTILELLRLERYGDDEAGQNGIGASIGFYLSDSSSQIAKRGDIEFFMSDASTEIVTLYFMGDADGDGDMEVLFSSNPAGGDVAFYDKGSGYHAILDFTGSVSSDQILTIDMVGDDRGMSLSDDFYVEAGAVDSRINQDLTTDSSTVAFEATTLNILLPENLPPTSASAAGTTGQVAFDSKYMYRAIETNTWKRVALSTWTDSAILDEDGFKILDENGDFILQE